VLGVGEEGGEHENGMIMCRKAWTKGLLVGCTGQRGGLWEPGVLE